MLINNQNLKSNVKFINYTGKWPSICNGILTLEIDGKKYTFGNFGAKPKPDFDSFWKAECSFFGNPYWNLYNNKDHWKIDVEKIPEEFRKYAFEIDKVFNENVKHYCCGMCCLY